MHIACVWRFYARFPQLPVQRYLLAVPAGRDSTFAKIRRVFMNPMKKVQPFGVLALCRGQCPRHLKSFGFEANDETAQLLLGIVHIWLLHHRMHRERMDTEKLLLWEYLWVHMRHILCAQEIHELQFRGNLEEMQHKTLGFCLALDESVGDYQQTGDPKLLKKMLLIYFYEKDETMMQSPQLDLLTKYILSQIDFVSQVPKREFFHAAFSWPEIDHYISQQNEPSSRMMASP